MAVVAQLTLNLSEMLPEYGYSEMKTGYTILHYLNAMYFTTCNITHIYFYTHVHTHAYIVSSSTI